MTIYNYAAFEDTLVRLNEITLADLYQKTDARGKVTLSSFEHYMLADRHNCPMCKEAYVGVRDRKPIPPVGLNTYNICRHCVFNAFTGGDETMPCTQGEFRGAYQILSSPHVPNQAYRALKSYVRRMRRLFIQVAVALHRGTLEITS